MYISVQIRQVEGPRGMHLRVGTAGIQWEGLLFKGLGMSLRTIGMKVGNHSCDGMSMKVWHVKR